MTKEGCTSGYTLLVTCVLLTTSNLSSKFWIKKNKMASAVMTDSRLLNVVGRHDRLTLTGLYPGWAIRPVFTSAWRYQATSYCQYKLGVYEHNIWESCSTAINGTPLHNTNLWQKTIELTEAFSSPTKTRLQPLRPFFLRLLWQMFIPRPIQ